MEVRLSDDLSILTTFIFAIIAGIVIFRLRSVLGKRTGEERQRPNPFINPGNQPPGVAPPLGRGRLALVPSPATAPVLDEPMSLAVALGRIHQADPSFDEPQFLAGARAAFEMIIAAFAASDTETLKTLLAPPVLANFGAAITAREKAGETLTIAIKSIEDVDLSEARLDGKTAVVTVRYVSHQSRVTRDKAGAIVDGDPNESVESIDLWSFARDTKSSDPNWQLVATRTA
jgi:predicted lipid-binding transport protein (Tim44 family)